MMQPQVSAPPTTASPELAEKLRAIVVAYGQARAVKLIGVSRTAYLAMLAGLAVRPGTVALATERAKAIAP